MPAPWTITDTNEADELAQGLCNETEKWTNERTGYEFEIDGLVFKVYDLSKRELLGRTAHQPILALAYKFPPEEATSV